jgi:hypothetical protein
MDDRKNNGGAREGAGRKPKADEVKLIESMDAIAVPDYVWKALYSKVLEGDTQAIKTWLSYRFGMPKQTVEQSNKVTIDSFNLKDVIKFKE